MLTAIKIERQERKPGRLARPKSVRDCAARQDNPRGPGNLLIIEPGRAERHYWRDLWIYRELFATLAWRDIAVRYKQTAIGFAWAVLRPLLTMVIFTVVFGRLAKLPSPGGAPYPVMVFAGMLPWFLFSTILTDAANSMVNSGPLISKVYFPRIIIPAAAAAVAVTDFLISFALLLVLMVIYRIAPSWRLAFVPLFVGIGVMASFGPALFITALNVRYRDFRYIIPFAIQIGLYVSPVGFSSSIVPHAWRFWYGLNPIVGVIDGFRWCILGGVSSLDLPSFGTSVAIASIWLWAGVAYFRKTERTFADVV